MYGVVPPVAVTVAEPLFPPLQVMLFCPEIKAVKAVGCVIVTLVVRVQPFASVTVTVYVPAVNPVAVAAVCPPVQAYVYGAVPPLAVTVAAPVLAPLHNTFI